MLSKEACTPRRFQAWGTFLVLKSLSSSPSGCICSETLALAINGLDSETDGSISIRFLPEFLAKNQPAIISLNLLWPEP